METSTRAPILWLDELGQEDLALVGGKNANLGELMNRVGAPVPLGFAINSSLYSQFLNSAGLQPKIEKRLRELDTSDFEQLQQASHAVRSLFEQAPIPPDIAKLIQDAYQELAKRCAKPTVAVAVRSSATAEDLPGASFAGQQDTFLNVGSDDLCDRVRDCWSSLFTPRAIAYRQEKGFAHSDVLLSVTIMEMVPARSSGVVFTLEPVTGEADKIVINAAWGLGEPVVSGATIPDEFVVAKKSLDIIKRNIVSKPQMCVSLPEGGVQMEAVPQSRHRAPSLSDEEIILLAEEAKKIEVHYGVPQDIEWAIDDEGRIYILQARPETVYAGKKTMAKPDKKKSGEVLLRGLGVSPGVGSGKARVILSSKEISRLGEGEVLVTEMTTPDWVPAMKIAAAIVTNTGGKTCHAAIVSRELGVPCVVGADKATEILNEEEEITVEGSTGVIYSGLRPKEEATELPIQMTTAPTATATKVYVNLSIPEIARKVAAETGADGVGLLRAEHLMLSIGQHPRLLIEKGQEEVMVDAFAEGIKAVAEAFTPGPVIYRFLDFKPDEFLELPGGEAFERHHVGPNPMIGYRGQFRYIKEDDIFRLELKAVRKVRRVYGLSNLWVMLPFVRTLEVFHQAVAIMREEKLDPQSDRDFKLWIMVEVPSSVFLIEEFCQAGIDGISFGTNDLTMLVMGVDRNDASVQELYDERNPAVLRAIAYCIAMCRKYGVTTSICGQAPSVYPDYLEFLLRLGSTSVSVNPDTVVSTRSMVASLERKIMLEHAVGGEVNPRVAGTAMKDLMFWRKLD